MSRLCSALGDAGVRLGATEFGTVLGTEFDREGGITIIPPVDGGSIRPTGDPERRTPIMLQDQASTLE
tara:strand:+ start:37873 stop:38076 length:204 start_codon:yes stop_codon:yes gene_type:complete